ncbi:MAG: metal-dependent transcriptional regulator [Actinomycetota bacterium]
MSEPHGPEGYLEAIYELHEEGTRVVQARIAQRLGVSRAAVSEQIGRLTKSGLVATAGDRELLMTERGRAVAEEAVRRHRMAERFLTDVLKMPWHLAHLEAEKMQTAISGEIEKRMMALLDGPSTCPHGNPIPGTGATLPSDLQPLNDFKEGDRVVLHRLLEDVELNTGAMKYFEDHRLMPGATISVTAVAPDGTMTLEVAGVRSALGPDLADNLWVLPA